MALVLIEGWDHFQVGFLTHKGWSSGATSSMISGRLAGQALRVPVGSQGPQKSLASATTTIYMGFGFRYSAVATNRNVVRFFTAAGSTIGSIAVESSKLVVQNTGSTTVGTGSTTLVNNTWYYVELRLTTAGASSVLELKLNGASEIASSTGNYFGSTGVTIIRLAENGAPAGQTMDYDDIYVCDTSGSANITFLGNCRVDTLYPVAAGSSTEWTPSAGSNYQNLDEDSGTFPNQDTDYNSDNVAGDLDLFDMTTLAGSDVRGVQVNHFARKTEAGSGQIKTKIKQGGTEYSGNTHDCSTAWVYYSQVHDTDPLGSPWTVSAINADEFGVETV